jgi:hypothetical protein
MNKYGSKNTTLTVRGFAESVITPPNDYTWPFSYNNPLQSWLVIPGANPDSNILLKSLSINSNFADGLVWKNGGSRIRVGLGISQLVNGDIAPGTVSAPAGSFVITGVATAFLANLIAGQSIIVNNKLYTVVTVQSNTKILVDRPVNAAFGGITYIRKYTAVLTTATYSPISKTVTVANSAALSQNKFYYTSSEYFYTTAVGVGNFTAQNYPQNTNSFDPLYSVVQGTNYGPPGVIDITQLNVPEETNVYLNPTLSGIEGADTVVLQLIIGANFDTPLFMTKSINTAFAGSTCVFDADLELEFTA